MTPEADWRSLLRAERQRLGFTQAHVAAKAGISAETVRKYETGGRTPDRAHLERLLVALDVAAMDRRSVLEAAGFRGPDTLFPPGTAPRYYFNRAELHEFVEHVPWPQFVADKLMEVVAANRAAQALWGIDFASETARRKRAQLNILAVAAERHFRERIINWDACLATMIGIVKALPEGGPELDGLGPLFEEVVGAYVTNDPSAIPRLLALWEKTPAQAAKVRWMYDIHWREPGVGDLHFRALVSVASEPDGLSFSDWIPLDATTHEHLASLTAAGPSRMVQRR